FLRLAALQQLGAPRAEVQAFMRSRIERLSPKERGPWLINLGCSYLDGRSWSQADGAFARGLGLVTGDQQARMLRAIFQADLSAGRIPQARQAAASLVACAQD